MYSGHELHGVHVDPGYAENIPFFNVQFLVAFDCHETRLPPMLFFGGGRAYLYELRGKSTVYLRRAGGPDVDGF